MVIISDKFIANTKEVIKDYKNNLDFNYPWMTTEYMQKCIDGWVTYRYCPKN